MTREDLKEHCEKQIRACEMWARHNGEEPHGKVYEEHKLILELLEQEPCEDCVSRKAVRDTIFAECSIIKLDIDLAKVLLLQRSIKALPPVTPQEQKHIKGEWLRMSDLSEQEDYRYKCSHCGNVINHKSKMDLYTFNSWCERCGSDNGRHTDFVSRGIKPQESEG